MNQARVPPLYAGGVERGCGGLVGVGEFRQVGPFLCDGHEVPPRGAAALCSYALQKVKQQSMSFNMFSGLVRKNKKRAPQVQIFLDGAHPVRVRAIQNENPLPSLLYGNM